MATYQGILLTSPLVGVRTFRSAAPGDRCLVKMRLFNVDGSPQVGQLVAFINLWQSPRLSLLGGNAMLAGQRASVTTNGEGYAQIWLLRGSQLQVVVTSTGFARRVTIPDAPEVDLADLVSAAPDQFEIARVVPVDTPRFTP